MVNLYWPIFKNIESSVIELSEQIHFDDKQLSVYSIKISELLIRCSVEIESISKALYFTNGGKKPDNNELYYDTDCLDYLEKKWSLSKKRVLVAAQNFYFLDEKNIILIPLYKANKRGSSGSNWAKSYQAVKHNRTKNLKKGNLKNLLDALAALYLLNLYFKDEKFDLKKDSLAAGFDARLGSEIFSVELHVCSSVSADGTYAKNDDFENCVYFSRVTEQGTATMQELMTRIQSKAKKITDSHLINKIKEGIAGQKLTAENLQTTIEETIKSEKEKIGPNLLKQAARNEALAFRELKRDIEYEALINKNQV